MSYRRSKQSRDDSPRRDRRRKKKKTRSRSESEPRRTSRSRSYSRSDSGSLHLGRVPALYRGLDGLVKCRKGDKIRDGRYEVLELAGQGTFGTVLSVHDSKHKEDIALKVVRSVQKYLDASYVEIDILDRIRKADKQKKSHIVRLYGSFTTKINGNKHVCIAFEKCGMSIYEFIKKNKYQGFEIDQIQKISRQIIEAVAFCRNIGLTHTDLKLENVLLYKDDYEVTKKKKRPRSCEIRLIDFGGATFEDQHHASIINTRQYRAPEVILGLPWSFPSDVWSIGCMLAELYTGELLFATHEDIEHIALMEKILGKKMDRKNGQRRSEAVSRLLSKKQVAARRRHDHDRPDVPAKRKSRLARGLLGDRQRSARYHPEAVREVDRE